MMFPKRFSTRTRSRLSLQYTIQLVDNVEESEHQPAPALNVTALLQAGDEA